MRRCIHTVMALVTLLLSSCSMDARASARDEHSSDISTHAQRIFSVVSSEPTASTQMSVDGGTTFVWQPCPDDHNRPELECAQIAVPFDYAQPNGERLFLAVMRYRAEEPRRGVILVNPGGPGSSAIDYLALMGTTYRERYALQHYDLVAFDPRGVGHSGRLKCQSDQEIDMYLYPDYTPDTEAERAFLMEVDQAFINTCRDVYPNRLHQFSTMNTVHDMERIRQAFGDARLSYVGISYGSYLGAIYASTYPDRFRVMVLDSAFAPDGDTLSQYYVTQAGGFERAFQRWVAWCEATMSCMMHSDDVGGRWDRLMERYDTSPVYAGDGRLTNQAVIAVATVAALYGPQTWGQLARALYDAEQGNVDAIWLLADTYYARNHDGSFANSIHAFPIISCASGFGAPAVKNPEPILNLLRQVAPRLGRDVSLEDIRMGGRCNEYMNAQPAIPIAYTGEAPVLIIGGVNDPATPIRWAYEMRVAMGSAASMVVYEGEGHGHLFESRCIDTIVARTLGDLALPNEGIRCTPDTSVAQPVWWHQLPPPDTDERVLDGRLIGQYLGLSPFDYYVSAYQTVGSTSQVFTDYDSRFARGNFVGWGQPTELNGAYYKYYFGREGTVGVYVLGSDVLAQPQFSYVRSLVSTLDSAIVVFFYQP